MRLVLNNVHPRTDVNGDILDAHDGNLQWFDDRFWLYGTRYGAHDGYGLTNRFVAYSSPGTETQKLNLP